MAHYEDMIKEQTKLESEAEKVFTWKMIITALIGVLALAFLSGC